MVIENIENVFSLICGLQRTNDSNVAVHHKLIGLPFLWYFNVPWRVVTTFQYSSALIK